MSKEIVLNNGMVVLVCEEDFECLNQFKWYAKKGNENKLGKSVWYAYRTSDGKKMHRLIMGTQDPKIVVDHIDGNGLNNQRSNLRECSIAENRTNSLSTYGTSKYKGVRFHKDKWNVSIKHNSKSIHIGIFENEENAARAWDQKARELGRRFGFNFPEEGEEVS